MKSILLVLPLIFLTAPAVAGVPEDLQRVTVTVTAGSEQGSDTLALHWIE